MIRSLFVSSLLLTGPLGCGECEYSCPDAIDVGRLCREGAGCTIDGEAIQLKAGPLEIGPGQKISIPLALARTKGSRDGITIRYDFIAPDERRLFASVDDVPVTIERYAIDLPTAYVRFSATASTLTFWYEGPVAHSFSFEAIDVACTTTTPVCGR